VPQIQWERLNINENGQRYIAWRSTDDPFSGRVSQLHVAAAARQQERARISWIMNIIHETGWKLLGHSMIGSAIASQ
jgi:hypothetical protein